MTGKHLKIKKMGDAVLGVKLEGNPQKPEPIYFRVVLPFGDVDIARCDGFQQDRACIRGRHTTPGHANT